MIGDIGFAETFEGKLPAGVELECEIEIYVTLNWRMD